MADLSVKNMDLQLKKPIIAESTDSAMNHRICVSIGEMPYLDALRIASTYPFVEVRLDLLKLDPEKIDILALQCRQWIATCRPGNLTDRERTIMLASAIRFAATYVDIEYESTLEYRQPLIDLAKKHNCKVIISYHNFETTPDTDTLNQIIDNSTNMGADLVKIAVTANSPADNARIISLYCYHTNLLAFAMGEVGRVTRITPLFVSDKFTFASVDEENITAPGQLSVSQLEEIFKVLY